MKKVLNIFCGFSYKKAATGKDRREVKKFEPVGG
jgi:hypothetical protein